LAQVVQSVAAGKVSNGQRWCLWSKTVSWKHGEGAKALKAPVTTLAINGLSGKPQFQTFGKALKISLYVSKMPWLQRDESQINENLHPCTTHPYTIHHHRSRSSSNIALCSCVQ